MWGRGCQETHCACNICVCYGVGRYMCVNRGAFMMVLQREKSIKGPDLFHFSISNAQFLYFI